MQRLIILIIALLVSLPVAVKNRVSEVSSAPAAFPATSSRKVVVRVSGDVRHSGIYEVNANTLAGSVINMAVTNSVIKRIMPDNSGVRPVEHGTALNVKISGDGTGVITVGSIPAAERIVLDIPLDINSMSEIDFDRLPGVGPVMARRIVEYRQYIGGNMRVHDLLAVEGIGEMKYLAIRKYF
ncbi:MAG: helix-hairpin-helix domain-containing protein [Desulfuromonadales bacterium]